MLKRIALLGMAITAVMAFLIPAGAGATTLTQNGGTTTVPIGSRVWLKQDSSFPWVFHHWTLGDMKCTNVEIPGWVTKNQNGVVQIVAYEGTASPCQIGGESGTKILKISASFESQEYEQVVTNMKLEMEFPSHMVCTFETVEPESEKYLPGTDRILFPSYANFTGEELFFEGGACGQMNLEGGLVLTSRGTPVEIN